MTSELVYTNETMWQPAGPRHGADTRQVVQGVLLGFDAATRRAIVSVNGGEGASIPVVSDIDWTSLANRLVWVLRDTYTGRSVLVLGACSEVPTPVTPEPELPASLPQTGTVTAVAAGGITVLAGGVSYLCSAVVTTAAYAINDVVVLMWPAVDTPWVIGKRGQFVGAPAVPATPAAPNLSRAGTTVTVGWVRPTGTTSSTVRWRGAGSSSYKTKTVTGFETTVPISQGTALWFSVRANGTAGSSAYSAESSITYSADPPPSPVLVTRTTTITPTWSGTWRETRSEWDRWNTNRYGGRSTLYQGNAFGSGDLTGLAVYGNQVSSLNAVEITKMELTLRGAGVEAGTVRGQGSSNGSKPSGAPNVTGATFTGNPGESGKDVVPLPTTVREAFRTGAVKGIATNGSAYTAVRGTSAAEGMALRITYTKYA